MERTFANAENSQGKSYKDALFAVNSLETNATVRAGWSQARKNNQEVDYTDDMRSYMRRLDIEPSSLSVIHVAGTKGKGSTCAFAESILRHHGYTTGLFTSPHLVSIRERIRLNGIPISQELFAKYFWQCYDMLERTKSDKYPSMPGFFRFMTLLALKVFQEEKVDVAVVEVGIGGRTDATNVFDHPVVCGITPLGFDHMELLGNTLTQIAFEKSGILKRGVPAFTAEQPEEGMLCLRKRAKELIQESPYDELPTVGKLPSLSQDLPIGLSGDHQLHNASLAIALCKTWIANKQGVPLKELMGGANWNAFLNELSPEIKKGLEHVFWPGRSQKVFLLPEEGYNGICLYLDGAHTPESIAVCTRWFQQNSQVDVSPDSNPLRVLVFNCKIVTAPKTLLRPLVANMGQFDKVLFCSNESSRDTKPDLKRQEQILEDWNSLRSEQEYQSLPQASILDNVPATIDYIQNLHSQSKRPVHALVTGSLYLISGWLEIVQNHCRDEE